MPNLHDCTSVGGPRICYMPTEKIVMNTSENNLVTLLATVVDILS